jgi:ASC-1-like (ASCH) protein
MAIKKKEEEKKVGMKITDNMDGETLADERLQAKYEPGVFSLSKYNKYKKALEEDNVKEVFPDESMFELRRMFDMYMKETGGRINKKKN